MNEMEARDLSDDLLLDNFHWSKTSDKYYDLFRAEIIRRLPANKKSAPEDVQLDVEARELAQIAADGVTFLDPELAPPKGLFLCASCGQAAEESKEQLEHREDCPIGKLLALLRRVSGKGAQEEPLGFKGDFIACWKYLTRLGVKQRDEEGYKYTLLGRLKLLSPAPVPATPRDPERDADESYAECSDEAVKLLAIIENADYEEGSAW